MLSTPKAKVCTMPKRSKRIMAPSAKCWALRTERQSGGSNQVDPVFYGGFALCHLSKTAGSALGEGPTMTERQSAGVVSTNLFDLMAVTVMERIVFGDDAHDIHGGTFLCRRWAVYFFQCSRKRRNGKRPGGPREKGGRGGGRA